MKAWVLLSTIILLLAGCTNIKYVKAGATDADFKEDQAECTQQILKTSIEANLAIAERSSPRENSSATPTTPTSFRQRVEQCLQSKGWMLETTPH